MRERNPIEAAVRHLEDFIRVLEGLQKGGLPLLSAQIADVRQSVEDLRWLKENS